jgi:hypothetical protein
MPNNEHSWKLIDVYRHQELKKEGNNGILRQFEHLKNIKELQNKQLLETK